MAAGRETYSKPFQALSYERLQAEALDKSPAAAPDRPLHDPPAASAKPLRRATGDAPPELVEAENNKAARRGVWQR